MSTLVRIQIKENLVVLHPHIPSSFKLQPLSKSTPVNKQIVYSIAEKKKIKKKNESKGEVEKTFSSLSLVESLSSSLLKLLLRGSNTSVYFPHSCSPPTTASKYLPCSQRACDAGTFCSLHFPDRGKRGSDLFKVTWEICEK